jgi:hypothetical protein
MPSRKIATPPISPRAYAGHVVLADSNKCDKFSAFGAYVWARAVRCMTLHAYFKTLREFQSRKLYTPLYITLLYIKLYAARAGAHFIFSLIRETGKTLDRWPMARKQAELARILMAMGSSKSVLSVAAAVVAGPPLVPESAMGEVNDRCVTRFRTVHFTLQRGFSDIDMDF